MSYASIAQLLSGQRPFHLYLFRKGGEEFRFTSLPQDLDRAVAGVTGTIWTATAISHPRIPYSSDSARSEFPITFPLSNAFARTFLDPIGVDRTTVTLWRGFLNDPDSELVVQYKGAVLNAKPSERGTIALTCMSDVADLLRKALPAVFQRPCRHVLYQGGCRLNLAAWQDNASATAISGGDLVLTFVQDTERASGYFKGGILEFNGVREMIIGHSGSSLTLAAKVPGLADEIATNGTASIQIAPGCNLTVATCRDKFGNLPNFGGFPKMSDTPFDGRSIV